MGIVGKSVALYPLENFGSDTGECAGVCVFTAVDQLESEINVLLLLEHETCKEEIASVKTSDCVLCQYCDSNDLKSVGEESALTMLGNKNTCFVLVSGHKG